MAVLQFPGSGQAGGHRVPGDGCQEGLADGGVDGDAADPQVPHVPAVDQGARAVVAGGVVLPPVVVDGEFAAAGPAGGQALQQGAALPDGAGPGLVGHRPDVPADALLVGQVVVPVQETLVVLGDAHLPVVAAGPAPPGPQLAIAGDVLLGAGAAVNVGAGVGRVVSVVCTAW